MDKKVSFDSLDDSYKISLYLLRIKDPIDYIKAQDNSILFISALTDGIKTQQVTDNEGKLIYWTDRHHVFVTTKPNNLPVLTYVYDEKVKLEIKS